MADSQIGLDTASPWKVVLLGAGGQLGTDLCKAFGLRDIDFLPLSHADLDICDYGKVAQVLSAIKPNVVVNTAALHRLEACEEDPQRAFAVNTLAVRNLAEVCEGLSASVVHISTDYIFDGDQSTPYREDAPPNPLNVYGVSKVAGEYFVRNYNRKHLLIRTSGLYGVVGASDKSGNFVETMRRLGAEVRSVTVVTDQILSPTYTADLAGKIVELIENKAYGLFHVTNSGECSWYEFAETIFELWDPSVKVKPTTTTEFGSRVARPYYSVLGNFRLEEQGFSVLRSYRDALAAYLHEKGNP